MLEKEPVLLSAITVLYKTFMLDCYKGKPISKESNRNAYKRGVQRDGKAIAETVNHAKPSGKKLYEIFGTHVSEETLVLTEVLRRYEATIGSTIMNVNHKENKKLFNLNTANRLHFYIK